MMLHNISTDRILCPSLVVEQKRDQILLIVSIVATILGILLISVFGSGLVMPVNSAGSIAGLVIGSSCIASLLCVALHYLIKGKATKQDPIVSADMATNRLNQGSMDLLSKDTDARDAHALVLAKLSVHALGRLALTCNYNKDKVLAAIFERAKEYGYVGTNIEEAKKHLQVLFKEVRRLREKGVFGADLELEKILLSFKDLNKPGIYQLLCKLKSNQVIEDSIGNKVEVPYVLLTRYLRKCVKTQEPNIKLNCKQDSNLKPFLTQICAERDFEALSLLLEIAEGDFSQWLLMAACSYPLFSDAMIRLLIERGTPLDITDNFLGSYIPSNPLCNYMTHLKMLCGNEYDQEKLEKKFNTKMDELRATAKLLIDHGAKLEWPQHNGAPEPRIPPLALAVSLKWGDIVKLMLLKGANVNIVGRSGRTALFYAFPPKCHSQDLPAFEAIARTLIDHGAQVYVTAADGNTPLHCAAEANCSKEMIAYLRQKGASIHAISRAGWCPIDLASDAETFQALQE